jgi:sulfur carrier protein ThiS
MMTIELALFAKFSSRHPVADAGRSARPIEVAEGSTLGDLIGALGLSDEPRISFINGRHGEDDAVLAEGDRVAVFPPIAGG